MVLIIGGAKRLGRYLVEFYSQESKVCFTYHTSEAEALELEQNLKAQGRRVSAKHLDVSTFAEIRKFAEGFSGKSISTLLYLPSVFQKIQFGQTSEEEMELHWRSNLKGAYAVAEAFHSKMKPGSNLQFFNDALLSRFSSAYLPYVISKAGLTYLVQILAKEWGPDVRVNEIKVGKVLPPEGTPEEQIEKWKKKIPAGTFSGPEALVRASDFLNRHSYITGSSLVLDGGASL